MVGWEYLIYLSYECRFRYRNFNEERKTRILSLLMKQCVMRIQRCYRCWHVKKLEAKTTIWGFWVRLREKIWARRDLHKKLLAFKLKRNSKLILKAMKRMFYRKKAPSLKRLSEREAVLLSKIQAFVRGRQLRKKFPILQQILQSERLKESTARRLEQARLLFPLDSESRCLLSVTHLYNEKRDLGKYLKYLC